MKTDRSAKDVGEGVSSAVATENLTQSKFFKSKKGVVDYTANTYKPH